MELLEIQEKLNIGARTIETVYELYRNKNLIVNRNYQRKLVWSIEEKEKFIDSIANGFPIPLFLVAEIEHEDRKRYEIIDGMQRLEAIVSFIEGDFSLGGKYFDLESTAITKYLRDENWLKQKSPLLEREKCKDIASYEIPLSVTPSSASGVIEEIFRRINANGKHLSRQEIRQAGVLNDFSKLVRHISETIRGDASHTDILPLNGMKKISLNNRGLRYGINIDNIFWCRNSIVTKENIRESRDEELVAYLLVSILTENELPYTAKMLDSIYNEPESKEHKQVMDELRKIRTENVVTLFNLVYDEIKQVLEASGKNFADLLFGFYKNYVNRAYQITFAAFYELLVKRQKQIVNYNRLAHELKGLGQRELRNKLEDVRENKEERIRAINSIVGIIEKHFVDRTDNDPVKINGITKIETLLSKSQTENNCYDFKIGFHTLDETKFKETNYTEVIKSLTAISNRGKGTTGYILVGIADQQKDAMRFDSFYNTRSILVGNFYVCGIEGEAIKGYKSLENYRRNFQKELNQCSIEPEYYKNVILEGLEVVNYYDKPVMILKIEAKDDPIKFKGKFYIRRNTSTEEICTPADERQLWKRFLVGD